MLPHYRVVVRRLPPSYLTGSWPRPTETSFIYYTGVASTSFLMVEFSQSDAALEDRWMLPSPEVSALLERHLKGLLPIGTEPSAESTSAPPWGMAIGVVLLAAFGAMLFEERRRWSLLRAKGAPERGL